MKRIFLYLSVFAVVISCIVFPVGAVSSKNFLDYNDYITNVTVDGNNDLCQWEFPVSMYSSDIYNETGKYYNSINSTNVASATFYANNSYRVSFYSPHFLIDNIPIDTTITTWFFLDATNYIGSDTASLNVGVSYFDKDGNFIRQINNILKEVPLGTGSYVDTVIRKDIPNAYGVQIFYQFNYFVASVSTQCTITLESSVFEASISSVYRQSQASSKTNRLLEEVNNQLVSNGDKLDEIINSTVQPSAPQESDKVGDLGNLEESIMDSAQDGADKVDVLFNDAPQIFALYASAFFMISTFIERFFSVGWVSNILTVSLALGFLGFIINLGVAVISKGGNSGKGGKGGKQ